MKNIFFEYNVGTTQFQKVPNHSWEHNYCVKYVRVSSELYKVNIIRLIIRVHKYLCCGFCHYQHYHDQTLLFPSHLCRKSASTSKVQRATRTPSGWLTAVDLSKSTFSLWNRLRHMDTKRYSPWPYKYTNIQYIAKCTKWKACIVRF